MEEIKTYYSLPGDYSEEKFVLASGLNDVLIAIGVGFLSLGIFIQIYLALPPLSHKEWGGDTFATSLFFSLMGLSFSWGLSEYLTKRRKLVLPSMVLVVSVAMFSYLVAAIIISPWAGDELERIFLSADTVSDKARIMTIMLSPIGVLLAYYERFRLPFTLLIVGAAATLAALVFSELFFKGFLKIDGLFLIAGCLIFLWAMRFDLKDPKRQTLFSDCAFWLHLLAAPLFVGSLTRMLVPDFSMMSSQQAIIIFLVVFILGFISVIIDRRSLLMAGLIGLGTSIAYAIKIFMNSLAFDSATLFSVTLLILGAFVLFLGVGWVPVRRMFLKFCVPHQIVARLRPVEGANFSHPLS